MTSAASFCLKILCIILPEGLPSMCTMKGLPGIERRGGIRGEGEEGGNKRRGGGGGE